MKGGWVLGSGVDDWTWVELKMKNYRTEIRSLEKDEMKRN